MTSFFFLILFIFILFVVIHLRPLNEVEIESLSIKKRKTHINKHFIFHEREYIANKDFKKKMQADGRFYQFNESLTNFPSIAASLLKYKKHEWIIIAFEKNKKVELCWMNKGLDRESVGLNISMNHLIETAKTHSYNSMIIFHNHPNQNPTRYDCTKPSKQDIKTATEWGDTLNKQGINLLEFICERGKHYQYHVQYSDSFMPKSIFATEIRNKNGKTKFGNFILHIERIGIVND